MRQYQRIPAVRAADASPLVSQREHVPAVWSADASPLVSQREQAPAVWSADASPLVSQREHVPAVWSADASPLVSQREQAPAVWSADASPLTRRWLAPFGVDVKRVLSVHRRGYGDPAFFKDQAGGIWRACRTPDGPGTLRVAARVQLVAGDSRPAGDVPRRETLVEAVAWGPGAGWLLDSLPGMLGAFDRPEDFAPLHPVLRSAVRLNPVVRIGRSGLVFESLVPAVLEQKVVGKEATRAWAILLRKYGEPAPGPARLRLPLTPAGWASIPSWEWHRAGVEGVRAQTIVRAARVASRMEEITSMSQADADRRLQVMPGIGPWTSAEIRQRACGDADAVSVGDFHLPSIVGWALAGKIVDDAGMLELLAPYPGHRHRAALMASLSGPHPPRRGPRMSVRDYRTF